VILAKRPRTDDEVEQVVEEIEQVIRALEQYQIDLTKEMIRRRE
jgi:hypothetical protein